MSQLTSKAEERIPSDDNSTSSSSSSSGGEEGWGFLLGGLSAEKMASTDWVTVDQEEEINKSDQRQKGAFLRGGAVGGKDRQEFHSFKNDQASIFHDDIDRNNTNIQNQLHYQKMFERAFCVSPMGQIEKPPVRILDRSIEKKGNVLIATRDIPKGSIIFTEKAFEAMQVPSPSPSLMKGLYRVRGCQNCFQSLEPASCISSESIPFSELWPVPEYDDGILSESQQECVIAAGSDVASTMSLHAKSGRITCMDCGAIFCNKYCAKHHLQTVGDCCKCSRAIEGLVSVIIRSEIKRLFPTNDDSDCEEQDCASFVDIDPVLVLAARMFVAQVRRYRADSSASDSLFRGLCGEAEDIQALGYDIPLALADDDNDDAEDIETTLQPLQQEYEAIAVAIELTERERKNDWRFSLRQFHKLVAVAQRNSISLTTGSPFRTYYQAMVRKTGGRGSSRQQKVVSDVARLLGAKDGKLTRDMDRIVEDKVRSIQILLSRANQKRFEARSKTLTLLLRAFLVLFLKFKIYCDL